MVLCRLVALVAAMLWGTLQGSSGIDINHCPTSDSSAQAQCRDIGGRCMCLLDPSKWSGDLNTDAEAYCGHLLSGSVVSLHNEEENDVLMALMANSSKAVWLGIQGGAGSYRWVDSSPVDYLKMVNGTNKTEDSCYIMKPGDGRWWPEPCTATCGVACTYPYEEHSTQTSSVEITTLPANHTTTPYAPCDVGCRVVNVSCLCVLGGSGNFNEMYKMCGVYFPGALPTYIMTEEENDILLGMIKNISGGVWIGLSRNGDSYTWIGGAIADYLNLGETSKKGDEFYMSSTDGKWYPKKDYKGGFGGACRYEPDPPITPTPPTTPTSTPVPTSHVPQGGPDTTMIIVAVVVSLVLVVTIAIILVIVIRRRKKKRLEEYANLTSHVDIG